METRVPTPCQETADYASNCTEDDSGRRHARPAIDRFPAEREKTSGDGLIPRLADCNSRCGMERRLFGVQGKVQR